jgi:uncharacterized damage-inducible protein DinB
MTELLFRYERGPAELRAAVAGMTAEQLRAKPVAGKWSTHEVVCHIADAEMLYADRIKRVLAEDKPPLPGMDPDLHVPRLAIPERDTQEELALIELVRKQMLHILRTLRPEEFQRQGIHSEVGPLTLETLLERVTNHIPHHVQFIAEKRTAMSK